MQSSNSSLVEEEVYEVSQRRVEPRAGREFPRDANWGSAARHQRRYVGHSFSGMHRRGRKEYHV